MAGFIYIMGNPAFPHLLKIGKSTKDPASSRVDELYATGLPEPFVVKYYCFVEDHDRLEGQIHQFLNEYRPNKGREFFEIEVNVAIKVIREIATALGGIKYEEPLGELPDYQVGHQLNSPNFKRNSEETVEKVSFPNAQLVIRYNAEARKSREKLSNISDACEEEFLELLEICPSMETAKIAELADKLGDKYSNPFDDWILNWFFKRSLKHGKNIAAEFKKASEILSPGTAPKEIFKNTLDFHGINDDVSYADYFDISTHDLADLRGIIKQFIYRDGELKYVELALAGRGFKFWYDAITHTYHLITPRKTQYHIGGIHIRAFLISMFFK